jgi:N-methylhydantoinase A
MDWDAIAEALWRMHRDALAELCATGVRAAGVQWQILVEMRYAGQGASLSVDFPYRELDQSFQPELEERFRRRYGEVFGGILPAGTPEVVTWRVAATSEQDVRRFVWPDGPSATGRAALKGRRTILCPDTGEVVEVPVYGRYALQVGTRLQAPLVLEEEESTIVVPIEAEVLVLDDLSVLVWLEA